MVIYVESVLTHRAQADSRKDEKPITMLGDRTGEVVARTFGLLNIIIIHLAYGAMFLVHMKGVVEAVKVTFLVFAGWERFWILPGKHLLLRGLRLK